MSPNDPTLQENQAAETSVRSEEHSRPHENSPENGASQPPNEPIGSSEGERRREGEGEAPQSPDESPTPALAVGSSDGKSGGESVPSSDEPQAPGQTTVSTEETAQAPQVAAPTETPPVETPPIAPPPVAEAASAVEVEAAAPSPIPPPETAPAEPVPTDAASAETPSTETDQTSRPRVTLDRSATEEQAKAVPSLPAEETGEQGENAAAAKPSGPVRGVEIPRSADLDPTMEQELNAALAGPAAAEQASLATGEGEVPQPVDMDSLQPGMKLKGTVQLVGEETVFIDLGLRSPGMIPARQFTEDKKPEPGQAIDVVVDKVDLDAGTLTVSLPRAKRKPAGNWDAVSKGQVVDAMVAKTNKGGLEVTVSSLRGFLPASQVDLGFVENLETYVGQKLTCVITEVNPQKRNLVLSRRAYLQQERKEKEKELWEALAPGQQHPGVVKTIKDYGAFVDLGGVDGFLHVGEISWNRINHPSDVLTVGETIQVSILKLDPGSRKIGLGMKQLQANPWADVQQKYPIGSTVSGKVTRTAEFGAFVELEEGVEGLIHISELDHRRVGRVTEVVNEGDMVDVKVLAVEPNRKRISLSLKALKSKPEPEKKAAAPEVPPYERKRKEPLRGGREGGPGGGLFGNPDDFR